MGLFPSEQEQIAYIDQAERVEPTPFAFSFVQEDIDDVLRLASNTPDSRMVIAAAFQEQKTTTEIAELMQKQYHGGAGLKSENGEFSVWYAEDGIHLAKGRSAQYKTTAQVISWETAAERTGQLMQEGSFVTNVELAEAYGHERKQLAQSLSHSKKWKSDIPLTDEKGNPLLRKNGKPMFRASYSILQDELFNYKNPYCYKHGKYVVKVGFSDTEVSLEERLAGYIRSKC